MNSSIPPPDSAHSPSGIGGLQNVSGLITGMEQLSGHEREAVAEIIKIVQLHDRSSGVPVGLVKGTEEWDLRPVILETAPEKGTLAIVRFSEPLSSLPKHRAHIIKQLQQAFSSPVETVLRQRAGVSSCGEHKGQVWIKRRWYETTLPEFLLKGALATPLEQARFCQSLLSRVQAIHSHGLVHGHIRPENVAVDRGNPVLVDFGFFASSSGLHKFDADSAPELRGEAIPDALTDVYGLGRIFSLIFGDRLPPTHAEIISKMCAAERSVRPTLNKVTQALITLVQGGAAVSGARGAVLDQSRAVHQGQAAVRAGKLLDPQGAVKQIAPAQQIAQPNAGPASQPMNSSAVVAGSSPVAEKKESASKREGQGQNIAARTSRVKAKQSSSNWLFLLIVLALVLAVGAYLRFAAKMGFNEARLAEYNEMWESGDPAEIESVAIAAAVSGDDTARKAILDSALKGQSRNNLRDGLLSVAFHPRWRNELRESDQKIAFTLALVNVLPSKYIKLPPLHEAHPGVLLAAVSDLDLSLGQGKFDGIKLDSFEKLPPPYGLVFAELNKIGISDLGQVQARAACHIVAGKISQPVLTAYFSGQSDQRGFLERFLVLLPLSELRPEIAPALMQYASTQGDTLKRRVDWFASDTVADWSKTSPSSKLFLVAGMFPAEDLSFEHLAELLRFPSAKVRAETADKLGALMPPTLRPLITHITQDQSNLSRDQVLTVLFAAQMLSKNPKSEEAHSLVLQWLGSSPPAETVLGILLSLDKASGFDVLAVECARYLGDKDWRATLSDLEALSIHSELLARAQAYSRLNPQVPAERAILLKAMKSETNQRLKTELGKKLNANQAIQAGDEGDLTAPF